MCSWFVLSISHFTAGLSKSSLFAVLNTMIDLNSEQALVKGLAACKRCESKTKAYRIYEIMRKRCKASAQIQDRKWM